MTDRSAAGAHGPADLLLDVLLFAPLGFVLDLPHLVPEVFDQPVAAFEHASDRGRRKAGRTGRVLERAVVRSLEHTQRTAHGLGLPVELPSWLPGVPDSWNHTDVAAPDRSVRSNGAGPDTGPASPSGADATRSDDEAPPAGSPTPEPEPEPASVAPVAPTDGTAIDGADLAIPDYESLSASQVMPRLEGLTSDELEAVRRFEHHNRGRKTILSKIAQLQAT